MCCWTLRIGANTWLLSPRRDVCDPLWHHKGTPPWIAPVGLCSVLATAQSHIVWKHSFNKNTFSITGVCNCRLEQRPKSILVFKKTASRAKWWWEINCVVHIQCLTSVTHDIPAAFYSALLLREDGLGVGVWYPKKLLHFVFFEDGFSLYFFKASYFCLWAKEPPACLPVCLKRCWLSLECCRYGSDAELWWALGLVGKNKGVRQRCTGIHSDIVTTCRRRSCCCFFLILRRSQSQASTVVSLCLLDPSFICFPNVRNTV